MNWLEIIGSIFKFLFAWFGAKVEKDAEKKVKQEAGLAKVLEGIKEKDKEKIVDGFDTINWS